MWLVMKDGQRLELNEDSGTWAAVMVNDLLIDGVGGQYKVLEVWDDPEVGRVIKYELAK